MPPTLRLRDRTAKHSALHHPTPVTLQDEQGSYACEVRLSAGKDRVVFTDPSDAIAEPLELPVADMEGVFLCDGTDRSLVLQLRDESFIIDFPTQAAALLWRRGLVVHLGSVEPSPPRESTRYDPYAAIESHDAAITGAKDAVGDAIGETSTEPAVSPVAQHPSEASQPRAQVDPAPTRNDSEQQQREQRVADLEGENTRLRAAVRDKLAEVHTLEQRLEIANQTIAELQRQHRSPSEQSARRRFGEGRQVHPDPDTRRPVFAEVAVEDGDGAAEASAGQGDSPDPDEASGTQRPGTAAHAVPVDDDGSVPQADGVTVTEGPAFDESELERPHADADARLPPADEATGVRPTTARRSAAAATAATSGSGGDHSDGDARQRRRRQPQRPGIAPVGEATAFPEPEAAVAEAHRAMYRDIHSSSSSEVDRDDAGHATHEHRHRRHRS